MAIPVPLLLLAGGVLLLGGKKKKKKEELPPPLPEGVVEPERPKPRPGMAVPGARLVLPGTGEVGKPWARCAPPEGSPEGTYAAFDADGQCRVFWNAYVFKRVKDKLLEEYEKSNKKKVCAMDKLVNGVWVVNKDREALVAKVIREIWPQIPSSHLPPVEGRSPYYVQMIWALSYGWFSHFVCGLNPVS